MNPLRIADTKPAAPLLALLFASAAACALVAMRTVLSWRLSHGYLIWNLFLAWMPMVLALLAARLYAAHGGRNWRFLAAAVAWLLFLPNAPYIVTDLTHLGSRHLGHFWVDLVIILLFALTGLMLGFVSLFVMHRIAARQWGAAGGWVFVIAVAALTGFGVWLGRFERWNSWDVISNPLGIAGDVARWLVATAFQPHHAKLPILFGGLFFVTYLMLHSLTHLPPPAERHHGQRPSGP